MQNQVKELIGAFQTSPISLVPKVGKPGSLRLIQNLLYPRNNIPVSSINHHIFSDNFPCTWGTFGTITSLIYHLPPGLQAAVCNVAEAYCTIALKPTQWLGVVVHLNNNNSFAINTSTIFGVTSGPGVYGLIGDATADIMQSQGIGPISKWVDNNLFIHILTCHLPSYNKQQSEQALTVAKNGGVIHEQGWLWYQGKQLEDN